MNEVAEVVDVLSILDGVALEGHPDDRELNSSVSKAAALLSAFSPDRRQMGVSEMGRRAGIPKSTAFRLLAILVEWGFVERDGPDYSPGQRLVELAHLVEHARHRALRDLALPYLQDLYELTHETVHLGVLDGTEVLYVEKIYGHSAAKSPSQVGGRLPAQCSALGKAMLAYRDAEIIRTVVSNPRPRTPYTIVAPRVLLDELTRIREVGVAFDREECRLGLGCVAAPVFDAAGAVIAAVSISGPTQRFNPQSAAAATRQVCSKITLDLRGLN